MKSIFSVLLTAIFLLTFGTHVQAASAPAEQLFAVDYTIELLPKNDQARVQILLGQAGDLVKEISFEYDPKRFSQFEVNKGKLDKIGKQVLWQPMGAGSRLSYLVRISRDRGEGSFDARMTADWAIFRGDRVIPSLRARMSKGASSRAHLKIQMPAGWTNVDTGWMRGSDGRFIIDNPERKFDRPIGWMVAGQIGTRRDRLGTTEVAIAAPKGDPLDRMDALTLINFVWPEFESAFGQTPRKILIVGAGDPMWRGGLSGPNSLFLHSERPLISENATSTLVHELVHVVTRIRGKDRSDWIAEGLAEFYSIELIYRAGGMTDERHEKVYQWLANWGGKVKTLRGEKSNAEITARAAVLLRALDGEIRQRSKGERSLDDVTRALRKLRSVSTADLIATTEKLLGGKSKVLATPLLR